MRSRSRTITPGFFTNEELLGLDPAQRLLFIGLWTMADCEGRVEYKPVQFKLRAVPVDNVDVPETISALERLGMVQRYESKAGPALQIVNFRKYQHPHCNEKPDESLGHHASTMQAPCMDVTSTPITYYDHDHGLLNMVNPGTVPGRPSAELKKKPRKSGKKKKPATACPDPNAADPAELKQWCVTNKLPWPLSDDARHFLNNHTAKGNTFVSWPAAWQTWQANGKKFSNGSNGMRGKVQPPRDGALPWNPDYV